jgi:hypothetical protein
MEMQCSSRTSMEMWCSSTSLRFIPDATKLVAEEWRGRVCSGEDEFARRSDVASVKCPARGVGNDGLGRHVGTT